MDEEVLGHISLKNEGSRRKCWENWALEGKEAVRKSIEAEKRVLETKKQENSRKQQREGAGLRGQVEVTREGPGGEESLRYGALGRK